MLKVVTFKIRQGLPTSKILNNGAPFAVQKVHSKNKTPFLGKSIPVLGVKLKRG